MLFWMILCDHESLFHHRLVLPCASRPHRDSKHLCFWDSGSWSAPILDLVEFARWLRKYWYDCKEFSTDWFQGETQYETVADVPESWVWLWADFQSGFRVLKKVLWTFSYLYPWHTMWFHAEKLLKALKFWKVRKKYLRRCSKKLHGRNFDFRAKSSWEKTFNKYKNFLSRGFCFKVKIVTAGLFVTPPYFCWQLALRDSA